AREKWPMSNYCFETEEHAALRLQARRFAEREIAPHAEAWDEAGEFPRELYKRYAEAGLLGVGYPEEVGGMGGDQGHALAAAEETLIAGKSAGTLIGLGSLSIAIPPIIHHG